MATSFKSSVVKHANARTTTSSVMGASLDGGEIFTRNSDGRYKWYEQYTDVSYSIVDDNKNISVDSSQINITQESNSQFIPFCIPRYYDGIDLMGMTIQIHYLNSKNQDAIAPVVNVQYSNEHIIFGWLIDNNVTAISGKITFEITASGVNEKNEKYIWKTKPNGTFNIMESLSNSVSGIIKPDLSWYESFLEAAQTKVQDAQEAANTAQLAAQEAKNTASALQLDNIKDDIKNAVMGNVDTEIDSKLADYYNKLSIDEKIEILNNAINNIDSLTQLKISYDSNSGVLTFRDNETLIKSVTIDSLSNLNVKYASENGIGKLSFYNGEALITSTELGSIDPSDEWRAALLNEVAQSISSTRISIEEEVTNVNNDLSSVKTSLNNLEGKVGSDENILTGLSDSVSKNTANIASLDSDLNVTKNNLSSVKNAANDNFDSINVLKDKVSGHDTDIEGLNTGLSEVEQKVAEMSGIKTNTYDVSYVDNIFTFYENEDVKQSFTIQGGGGGGVDTSTITIERITDASAIFLNGNSVNIKYNFSSIDNTGDTTGNGTASWKVNGNTVATSTAVQGDNSFDMTKYLSIGSNVIRLTITDAYGNIGTKQWTIEIVEFYVESNFDDGLFYSGEVAFRYTPYGDMSKMVHFVLDKTEIAGVTTTITGRQQTQAIPAQKHGAHLLEVYITATINNEEVKSESIYKDIIWVEEGNNTPIIGCSIYNFEALQYDSTTLDYVVYDPNNNPTSIKLQVDDDIPSTLLIDRTKHSWNYKTDKVGEHTLKIICGEITKTITAVINSLGIDVSPVTTNLVFDFNPTGKSNNDENRLWTDNTYHLSVSDNFDWVNGGYQIDSDGNTYFCVKSGNIAQIDCKLFADDAKKNGKNFKLIYKTTNVKNYDAQALTCKDGNIGLIMQAQTAYLTSEQNTLTVPYVEDNKMEFEFNIRPDSEPKEIITYEDGVPSRSKIYAATDNFTQTNPQYITIGSKDCDVWIYRMKSYSMNLTNDEVIQNFIADGLNANDVIDRYLRNNILNASGDLDPDTLAERTKDKDLRIIKISSPTFTTGKKNEVDNTTVQHIYNYSGNSYDNWTATGSHKGQGTTSNLYGEAGRNIDINLSGGFTFEDDTTGDVYCMTPNSIGVNYFNIKVNIASSEGANNALLQDEYNLFNPYKRNARINNDKVRDTLEFHPCVVFIQETDTVNAKEFTDGKWHFYACGNFGNSKKNYQVLGNDPTNPQEVIIEVCNNTSDLVRFKSDDFSQETWDGETDFEWRYEMKNITEEQRETNKQNWINAVQWVVNATPEIFVKEFEDHFIKNSCLFYYLFTERYTMVDNRAKNVFWHTEDGIHYDLCMDYDNDTALGNNNEGALALTYGLEDTDQIGTKDVFNAADSKFFCYIRDYMKDDLAKLYRELENKEAWNSKRLNNKFNEWQNVFPERLLMADMQRKYFRPYEDNGTTTYIEEMMYGRKRYQREQFNTYQEKYISSKYMGSVCTNDSIMLRGYTPTNWKGIKPDGTLHITPYADMYVSCMIGSNVVQIRGKRGIEYTIDSPVSVMNDTEMAIYTASEVQKIGDLSACYVGYCDLTRGVKLQELILGSNIEGYVNTNLSTFSVGNNTLLEKLNLQNLPNLKQSVDLSGCINLEEIYAEGSGITGIIFASGGKIKIVNIPAVSNLTIKNLIYLETLNIESFDNIATLIIENCNTIDALTMIESCKNLNRLRLLGVDWRFENTDVLDSLLKLSGVDENGYNTTTSIISGNVYVPVMRQNKLDEYNAAWTNLNITYDTMVIQYKVTFVNDDGTVLDVQYVDKGGSAVNPIERLENPIPTPTKESTVSTSYTFNKWDSIYTNIFTDKTVTAIYTESVRNYTVKYVSRGTTLQETLAPYGAYVEYNDVNPTYTAEEGAYKFYFFDRWDTSGYVNGNKTVNAIFDTCEYTEGCFDNIDSENLTPVQLYAMMKLGIEGDVLSIKDGFNIPFGMDYSYDDIEEVEVISNAVHFNGTNYIDSGLKLMETDQSFTIAIDFEFDNNNTSGGVLAQCYQSDGSNGFKLWYNNGSRLNWGTDSVAPSSGSNRELIVIRHIKGNVGVTVYNTNLTGNASTSSTLSATRIPVIPSELVFGCSKADDGEYENYAKGYIHWCKIWKTDLGENACSNIAKWIHEEIPFELAKFKSYYLSNSTVSKRAAITLFAKNALSIQKPFGNSDSTGGWKDSTLNSWMNTRLLNAVDYKWKSLIQPVKVYSSIGNKSNELSQSNCSFYIPSIYELDNSMSSEPYINETNGTISYCINDTSRMRTTVFNPQEGVSYFTRSPNVNYTTYIYTINEAGYTYGFSYPSYSSYIVPMISLGTE